MRAVMVHEYGGPEVLQVEDVPTPQPGPGQALVRVEAAGVNFIDIYYRTGAYKTPPPFGIGSEGAGVVEVVGPGVAEVAVGERVGWNQLSGAYATHCLVPADRLVPIPDNVTVQDAAAVMLQGLTAHYLSHSTYPLQPGETCLIHAAAGGLGLLLTQVARMRGARVIGTAGTNEKAALARQAGAEEVIVYTRDDFPTEVRRLTNGQGVQVVYDSVGKDTFNGSLDSLARRGYLVLCGQSSGAVPPMDPQILNQKGSLYLTRPTLYHYIVTRQELLDRARDVLGWVGSGQLKVRIGATFPLEQAGEAQSAIASRQTTGKVLLLP